MSTDARIEQFLARYDTPEASVARLLCDDHPAGQVAFTLVDQELGTRDVTYGWLRSKSECFAASLAELGVAPGDCVGVLMARSEELLVALLGIWRLGAVHVPLFTAFAGPAIEMRLSASGAKAVVVDADQRSKLDAAGEDSTAAWQVITVGSEVRNGDVRFADLLASRDGRAVPTATGGDAPFIMIFTSGTTGVPKGVATPVRGLAHMVMYLEYGLDVRGDDVYWCAADHGWAYGLFYAIVAPLAAGRRNLLLLAPPSAELSARVLQELGVTNYAAAPTVYRAMRNAGLPTGVALRCASSAGEPLPPDMLPWSEQTLGTPIRDHYGQTELGMVVANAWHPELRVPIKPGSMGRPLPGHRVDVLLDDADESAPDDTLGRVAVDTSAPLYAFTGYHGAPERTAERLTADGRWYLTGDAALRDAEGSIFFSARDDDVIIMAGYRIGPFDVESALLQHPDVAEAAAIGVPDELRGEVIEAFVVLRGDATPSDALTRSIQQQVKSAFAAHAYPRAVHYTDALPKTPSGKIQRYLLRAQRRVELEAVGSGGTFEAAP